MAIKKDTNKDVYKEIDNKADKSIKKLGRPFGTFKYDNLEDLENGINKYFEECKLENRPYTLSGLAYALNIDRKTLLNYGKNDDYFPAVSRARARCEQYAAESVYDRDKANGAKFTLSVNHDWREEQTINLNAKSVHFGGDDELTD